MVRSYGTRLLGAKETSKTSLHSTYVSGVRLANKELHDAMDFRQSPCGVQDDPHIPHTSVLDSTVGHRDGAWL